MAQGFVLDVNLRVQKVLGLDTVKQQLAGISTGNAGQTKELSTGLKKMGATASVVAENTAKASNSTKALGKSAAKTGKQLGTAANKAQGFGDQIAIAGKRYAAFLGATVAAFKAFQLISVGTKSVIEFDQAMVSLSQIMDIPISQLGDLKQQFLDLSIATGTSASEIANAAKLLAQAGFRGDTLTEAVTQLAKTPLTPIFEGMEQAVDGAIAALKQFGDEGLTVETVFDKMLAVSNDYAASFPDIIEGLKRGGSAFQAIGGTLDEFIAAFTTIRSVTRESASAVGTSIKTLSTRLADPKIIKFLETKGIRVIEKGQFIGPLEAIRKIGDGLENTKAVQDKVNIAVKLGGRRQVGRFLAISQNVEKTNQILGTSVGAMDTFSRVADQGLQSVAKQIDILINKAKKLAIDLGEELFIPFIKGLSGAAEAAIVLVGALGPILPAVAKIGTALGGIAIAKGIGGLIGPRLAAMAGPAAFAASSGGLRGKTNAAVGASPFIQAGLLIAASEVAASFFRTSEGADTFTSTLVTSVALITATVALFRKQTIAQFATGGGLFTSLGKKGGLGALGGSLATGGVVALGLAISDANRSSQELTEKIVKSAVESIAEIEIDPNDSKSLELGLGNLYKTIGQSVQELIEHADPRDEPSFAKVFASVGRTLSNVFEGDFESLITRGGLTTTNVRDHVQEIIKKSGKIIDDVLKNIATSIVQEGKTARTPSADRQRLVKAGLDQGLDINRATEFAHQVILSTGGMEAFSNSITKSVEVLQKEADKREKLIQLTQIFIPPGLVGQLLQFSKAVDKTTKAINISSKLFESQISEISGGIQAPSFEFDFGAKQIERLISTEGLKDLFSFTPNIPKFIGGITEVEEFLDQFIINISNLGAGADISSEVNKFFDFQKNLPKTVRDNFQDFFDKIGDDIQLVSGGKLIDAGEIKKRFEAEFAGLGFAASDAAVETVGKFLSATFAQIQNDLNRLATIRRFELAEPVRPESQAAFLEQQLRRVNIAAPSTTDASNLMRGTIAELELIRQERAMQGSQRAQQGFLPTPDQGFFEGRGQRLADIAGNERVRRQVRDSFKEIIRESTILKTKLANLTPDDEGFTKAAQAAKALAVKTIELQTTMEGLANATQAALASELQTLKARQQFEIIQKKAGLERAGISPIKGQRAIFELQQEHLREQLELQQKYDNIIEKDNALRTTLAKDISESTKTQAEVVQEFDVSANIIAEAARVQLTTAEAVKQHISDFGQAVGNFSNLGASIQPRSSDDPRITPAQIRSGGVNIQQAYDEFNRLLNNVDDSGKERINILNAIYDRQEQLGPDKKDPSATQKEQERSTEANDQITKLTESMDGLRTVLAEPSEVKLVTDQRIDLDISTLPLDIADEIRPLLEEAVLVAAKTVTRKALESLAAKSEPEAAIAATDVAQELSA